MHVGDDGRWGVWISAPIGSELKKYSPDPFGSRDVFNAASMRFSPDNKSILLFRAGEQGRNESLAPALPTGFLEAPASRSGSLSNLFGTPRFGWLPDSRRIVASTQASSEGASAQLWIADTVTGRYHALTSGTTHHLDPVPSPDGAKILYLENAVDFDIVSANLATAKVERMIATDRNEEMPAWVAGRPVLAYVTDRNGPLEIWVRSLGGDRPAVTAKDFPPGTTGSLWGPSVSPDSLRVIYIHHDIQGHTRLWMSAVSGGIPTPVTKDGAVMQFPGSWLPDGVWYAYRESIDGKASLMKAKTTGRATPIPIRKDLQESGVPCWSPDGKWISFGDRLYSPDGQTTRLLPKKGSPQYIFSADGARVYGVREEQSRQLLFFVDLATGEEKVVGDLGKGNRPWASTEPGISFSLSPDGKSFAYTVGKEKGNLWLLEGFEDKAGLLARFGLRR